MNKLIINNSNYEIQKAKIVKARKLTDTEKFFEIYFLNEQSLDHEPGQFVEVSIFGAGEAPISIASSPTKRSSFDICVRSVGRLTNALHSLDVGDEIGIRGPFGKGFPLNKFHGKDLLFVAGGLGIVPLRSLIHYVMDNRRDFGKITILLGCKNPQSMLFADEMTEWEKRLDINFLCTIEKSAPDWAGNVGLITQLIPGVTIEPANTYAVVVGPPIMYKFVLKELLAKNIPGKQIFLSLERHMKCGLGKCGHCQIYNIYCCQDGPVFCYEDIKNIKGVI